MNQVMEALARSRPVFHSESDFKYALSWQVQLDHPAMRVRQEVGNLIEGLDRRYVDIWFPDSGTAVELKYRTAPAAIRLDDEHFDLKGQGATLISRYDFWHDVARLEGVVLSGRAKQGYAILLTNDHLYWDPRRRTPLTASSVHMRGGRLPQLWHGRPAQDPGRQRTGKTR